MSHLDVFPSIMEYLRLPIRDEWELDGKSRIEWESNPVSEKELCDLTYAKSVIALSGGYIFDA